MLEVCALTKRYHGIFAVENVSFSLRQAKFSDTSNPTGRGRA